MRRVDEISWPKPGEEFIRATFAIFAEHHPWVGGDDIRPKGVAREIYETSSAFDDYVKRMEIARVEGVLLRYLGQVHDTLARTVPQAMKTDDVEDMLAFFRALVARVDSSLIEAWEEMIRPGAKKPAEEVPPREYDLAEDPRALRARIRTELQGIVRALSKRRYDAVPELLHPSARERWDARAIEAAVAPFYDRYEWIVDDPRARQAHLCVIDPLEPRLWRVRQVLLDEQGDNFWAIEGQVDLRSERNPADPLLELRSISG